MARRLIFVYNADSGLFNTLSDMAHKLVSPDTYECRLCELTHGVFTMHRQWRDFLSQLGEEGVFLHRDQFHRRYPDCDAALPAVFLESGGQLQPLLTAIELSDISSLSQLQTILLNKLR